MGRRLKTVKSDRMHEAQCEQFCIDKITEIRSVSIKWHSLLKQMLLDTSSNKVLPHFTFRIPSILSKNGEKRCSITQSILWVIRFGTGRLYKQQWNELLEIRRWIQPIHSNECKQSRKEPENEGEKKIYSFKRQLKGEQKWNEESFEFIYLFFFAFGCRFHLRFWNFPLWNEKYYFQSINIYWVVFIEDSARFAHRIFLTHYAQCECAYNNKSVRVNWQQCKCRDPIVNCIIFSTAVGLFSWYMEYMGCWPVDVAAIFFFLVFLLFGYFSVSTLFCALSFFLCKWCEVERIAKKSSSENGNCVKTTSGTAKLLKMQAKC